MLNLNKKYQRGFTLIELLVVIAIIGLIATLSVIALNNARAKSRDAKRTADIKQMQTALELYFNDKGRYPTTAELASGSIFSTTTNSTTTYMAIIPTAPTPPDGNCTTAFNQYVYGSAGGATYMISYCLGGSAGQLNSGKKCANPGGVTNASCGGDDYSCPGVPVVQYEGGPYNSDGVSTTIKGYYRTVQIGSQCWLRDNLNVGMRINSCVAGACSGDCTSACTTRGTTVNDQTNNLIIEKYCYDDLESNCAAEGGMYQWAEAVQYLNGVSSTTDWDPVPAGNVRGICPNGWHIPTDDEYKVLETYLGMCAGAGAGCVDATGWRGTNQGTMLRPGGSSHFELLQNGSSYQGAYNYHYISTSWVAKPIATYRHVEGVNPVGIYRSNPVDRTYGLVIRCIKD